MQGGAGRGGQADGALVLRPGDEGQGELTAFDADSPSAQDLFGKFKAIDQF